MCQSLQSKQGQAWIPDFLKDTSGTRVEVPDRKNPVDVPLAPADVDEFAIERRREELRRQYSEAPGSIRPNPRLSRKDVMKEIT